MACSSFGDALSQLLEHGRTGNAFAQFHCPRAHEQPLPAPQPGTHHGGFARHPGRAGPGDHGVNAARLLFQCRQGRPRGPPDPPHQRPAHGRSGTERRLRIDGGARQHLLERRPLTRGAGESGWVLRQLRRVLHRLGGLA
ncbi:Hypothetical protein CAP_0408 [Chondromyces apiculatus DSM 436]|uniref:Uncharacterized protein n=1 Tax=Chondromyces apiculatus DSM 436 TaxID=1192034 RepID=A0A017SVM9_9BACT|nr:Hypothetical protein CAP_0408 [Chondromyces apiculatus DSM 436]